MCVGDLSNAVGSAQIHTGLSKSMWRPRGGPRSRRREVRTGFGISSGENALNVNVNVNVGVRVTVSAHVNVCRGCFKCGG